MDEGGAQVIVRGFETTAVPMNLQWFFDSMREKIDRLKIGHSGLSIADEMSVNLDVLKAKLEGVDPATVAPAVADTSAASVERTRLFGVLAALPEPPSREIPEMFFGQTVDAPTPLVPTPEHETRREAEQRLGRRETSAERNERTSG